MKVTSIVILLSLLSLVFAAPVFKSDQTAAQVSSFVNFSWTGFSEDDIDPRIMFWQQGASPIIDKLFIEGSWEYTYGGIEPKQQAAKPEGRIAIKTPALPGLYNVYYCFTNSRGAVECYTGDSHKLPIAVITCNNARRNMKFDFENLNYEKTLTSSKLEHIIVIVSENHSFDSIYGSYCTAPTGSKPTCNDGPNCCEAAPKLVNGIKPVRLTDLQNSRYSPCHDDICEYSEINGGKMDKYVIDGTGADPQNWSVATCTKDSAKPYCDWAANGAMSDNFFQSSSGASCENDMYFATAKYIFRDNEVVPQDKNFNGARCYAGGNFLTYNIPTVSDLLNVCGVSWTWYAEGYDENPSSEMCYPLYYDASDNPFTYFKSLTESKTSKFNFRDYNNLFTDLVDGTLPSVSYVKGLGIHSEHPSYVNSFESGQKISQRVIDAVNASKYKENTVVILVPDESGGYYDHISPPHASQVDGTQYGVRTQFIVVGDMAKKNYISHTLTEPSSIIRFIEWNWLGAVGQLGARDAAVNNIGDLFDEEKVGIKIPDN